MPSSFTPRCTTALILIGVSPAFSAASMPSSTRATSPRSPLMREKTASSRLSRLTVIRRRPASASACARCASSMPFVVSAMSRMPSIFASESTSAGRSVRSSGSPPVMRSFSTPSRTKMRASRSISSKLRISAFGRNA